MRLFPNTQADVTALVFGGGIDRSHCEAGPVIAWHLDDVTGRAVAVTGITDVTTTIEMGDGTIVDLASSCYWDTRSDWAAEMKGQPLASITRIDPTPKLVPEFMLLVATPQGGWSVPKASRAEALEAAGKLHGRGLQWRIERRLCAPWEVDCDSIDRARGGNDREVSS